MMAKWIVLGTVLCVTPAVMAAATAGMALMADGGGSATITIDLNTVTLPTAVAADLMSTGVEPGGFLEFDTSFKETSGPPHYFTLISVSYPGVNQVTVINPPDPLDPFGPVIGISDMGQGIANPGKLADIGFGIAAGPQPGETYTIELHNAVYLNGSYIPVAPSSQGSLDIVFTPEPAAACLLLAGLPFVCRRGRGRERSA